jgi:NADPH:quinone reductase-like Zn-dependent oxidoreductase
MFAVYAKEANPADPLASLVVGELPEPVVPDGWVRVKVSHASLNRHDIFTLMGVTAQQEPIPFPMILGNDGAGTLDDGTEVVIYPLIGAADWHGDETLDPAWHVLSERVPGTMADYVAVPMRNVIPRPAGLAALDGALLGTAWLTAYRALFTVCALKAGETVLVQGASGGMATALIQMGRAAGLEVWATSRDRRGSDRAERLGASRTFRPDEALPRQVDAVIDNVGAASWAHSLRSVRRGGTVVINGVTTGSQVNTDLLWIIVRSIAVRGTIMGTLQEMQDMIRFVINAGIHPQVGLVVPMAEAQDAFRAMVAGEIHGKIVLAR